LPELVSNQALVIAAAAVRLRFLLRLRDQSDDLREHVERVETGERMALSLQSISDIAHKISGLAQLVGFAELGATAAKLDQEIFQYLDGGMATISRCKLINHVCYFIDQCDAVLASDNS